MWDFITDFADTAVTVPLAILTLGFLGFARQRRALIAWAFAILACAGTIGAIKAVLAGCGYRMTVAGVTSPSGHAAMGTTVYGALALILASGMPARARTPTFFATALFLGAIWVSRPVLGAHNIVEVVVGAAIGIGSVIAFRLMARKLSEDLPVRWLGAGAVFLIVLLHGWRWPTERAVRGTASYLHAWLPWCS